MLTQEELKNRLSYDRETGLFFWVRPRKRVKKGDKAGCNSHGYIVIRIDGVGYQAHRLAWLWEYGEFPSMEIDHINRDRKDNRISNLRLVSSRENKQNARAKKTNKSGFVGVCFDARRNKFKAEIRDGDGRKVFLGRFDTLEEAVFARKNAEIIHQPARVYAEKIIYKEVRNGKKA